MLFRIGSNLLSLFRAFHNDQNVKKKYVDEHNVYIFCKTRYKKT